MVNFHPFATTILGLGSILSAFDKVQAQVRVGDERARRVGKEDTSAGANNDGRRVEFTVVDAQGMNAVVRKVFSVSPSPSESKSPNSSTKNPNSSPPSVSPSPSESPTQSLTPSVSLAPTVDCTCCDCTHTSGCNPDPHYTVWGGAGWYDFQGACDQIAIDNDILQLQIRTRPRNYYSTITEVALIMKSTREVFRVRSTGSTGSAIVTNNITSAGASYVNSTSSHVIEFVTPAGKSFIRINDWSGYGLSVQVLGQGYIFSDSVGMFGSWNYGDVRFSNGTVFDMSGGYSNVLERSFELAESWKVSLNESLMETPSDICGASPVCGDYSSMGLVCEDFEKRRLSAFEVEECNTSCEDITIKVLREACEKDLELSDGDTSWACQPSYVNPVFVESNQCEFNTVDAAMCSKTGDRCQRLGGFCKLDCADDADNVCVPDLCSYDGPKSAKSVTEKRVTKSRNLETKSTKAPKAEIECQCFVPVKC